MIFFFSLTLTGYPTSFQESSCHGILNLEYLIDHREVRLSGSNWGITLPKGKSVKMFYIRSRRSENVFLEHFQGSLNRKIFCWTFYDLPFMRTHEYDWTNTLVTLRFHEQMNINCAPAGSSCSFQHRKTFFSSFHIIPFHLFPNLPFCPCISLFSNFILSFPFILNRLFHFPHSFTVPLRFWPTFQQNDQTILQ